MPVFGLKPLGVVLLLCMAFHARGQADFACKNCLFEPNSTTPRTLRAMYLPASGVVENPAAVARAVELGLTDMNCDDAAKAIPECFVGSNWNNGWVAELSDRILTSLGVNIVAMTRANFSAESAAQYTGVSSFTRMFLVTRIVGTEGFKAEDLMGWSKPFTPEVWATTIGAFIAFGLALWIVEAPAGSEDFDHDHRLGTPIGFLLTTWMSFMAFCTAAPMHGFSTWPGRIIGFGFAFMIFILVASYTASLATLLITSESLNTFVVDLSDARANARKVCMLEPLSTVLDLDPKLKRLTDDYGPALDQTKRGVCGAAVVGAKEYRSYLLEQDRTYTVCQDAGDERQLSTCQDPAKQAVKIELDCQCSDVSKSAEECPEECPHFHDLCDLIKVENLEGLSIPFSMPVAKEFQDPISAWIVELKFGLEGDYVQTLMTKHGAVVDETKPLPDVCGTSSGGGGGGEEDSLDIKSMAADMEREVSGTFTFSGAFLVLGMLVHVVQLAFAKKDAAEEEEDLPVPPNPHNIPRTSADSETAHLVTQLQKTVAQMSSKIDALTSAVAKLGGEGSVRASSVKGATATADIAIRMQAEDGRLYPLPVVESAEGQSISKELPKEPSMAPPSKPLQSGEANSKGPIDDFMNHDLVKTITFRQ